MQDLGLTLYFRASNQAPSTPVMLTALLCVFALAVVIGSGVITTRHMRAMNAAASNADGATRS